MAIEATAKETQPKHRIIRPDISTIDLLIQNDATNSPSSKRKISGRIGPKYRIAHEFAFNWFLNLGKKRECGLPYITHSLFTSLQFFGFTNGYIPINDWGRENHMFGGLTEHSVFKALEGIANASEFLYKRAQEDKRFQSFASNNTSLFQFASKNLASYFASYDTLDLLESKPTLIGNNTSTIENEIYAVVSVLHDVIEDGSRSLEEAEENLERIENLFGNKKEDIEYGKFIAYNVDILTNKYSLILGLVEDRIKKRNLDTYFEIVDCITGKLSNDESSKIEAEDNEMGLNGLSKDQLRLALIANVRENEIRIKKLVQTDLKEKYDPAYYRDVTRAINALENHELKDAKTARIAILERIKKNGKSNFDNIRNTLMDIQEELPNNISLKYSHYFKELIEITDEIETDPQYQKMSRQKRKEVSIFRLMKIQGYEIYTGDIMKDALTRLEQGDPYFDICPLSKMGDNIDNLETMNPSKRSSIKWTLVKAAILNKRLTDYHIEIQEHYAKGSEQISGEYSRIHSNLVKQHRMALITSTESRKIANRNFTSLRYAISMIPYLEEKSQEYRERFGINHRIETVDAFKRYKYRSQRHFRNTA
jgi:hypothetical protein